MSTTTYQPETRTLAQIKRDYHRSLHPSMRQSLRGIGNRLLRGIFYLCLALLGAALVYVIGLPALFGTAVILIVLSMFTAR